MAVVFQCWTAGKEEIWRLWLRACFITMDPAKLCKMTLKIQTGCADPSLAGGTDPWARQTLRMHKYIMSDTWMQRCLVRERLGLGVGQGRSRDSQKPNPLAQKYVKELHEEAVKKPLPVCPGHRTWPQRWSKVVYLSHIHKARCGEKSTAAEQTPLRAVSDSRLLLGVHHRFLNQASSRSQPSGEKLKV